MKRLVVVSDTHGALNKLRKVLETERDMDALIFLGDGERDLDRCSDLTDGIYVYRVRGNCDYTVDWPIEGLAAFEHVLFFYTHGHAYRVKYDLDYIADAAKNRGADVALFGHTHTPLLMYEHDKFMPTLFNPGSLGYGGTYGVITCVDGQAVFQHRTVKD